MVAWRKYLQPYSVTEAVESLQTAPQPVKIVAGGTDLLLDIQQGRHPPVHTLVDVTSIPELRAIKVDEDGIFLGSAMTHFEILHSAVLDQHARCLVEASGLIGGPQVRNVATIGGNVAHALPAGDGTIALLALAAQAEIAGPGGRRWVDMQEIFQAPGQTTLADCDLLTGFRLPLLRPGEASAFHRIMRPQGVAIAILNMAAWLCLAPDGTIDDIRLAVGPAGPRPFRSLSTEALLRGRQVDEETLALAARALADEAHLRASPHRATLAYRQHLLPILLRRVMETAQSRVKVNA